MAKHCTNCGVKLLEGSQFCTECGAKAEQTPAAPAPPAPSQVVSQPQQI